MELFDDTRALFSQIGDTAGSAAVKTLIENHDAWTHGQEVGRESLILAMTRLGSMPRDAATQARIVQQRRLLEPLVMRIPPAYAAAV